jgi:hypothetical protein
VRLLGTAARRVRVPTVVAYGRYMSVTWRADHRYMDKIAPGSPLDIGRTVGMLLNSHHEKELTNAFAVFRLLAMQLFDGRCLL